MGIAMKSKLFFFESLMDVDGLGTPVNFLIRARIQGIIAVEKLQGARSKRSRAARHPLPCANVVEECWRLILMCWRKYSDISLRLLSIEGTRSDNL
jgi:hypothetical protein